MKFILSDLLATLRSRGVREHASVLWHFLFRLVLTIASFSVIFHYLMLYEGQQHSWLTGVYWTFTVMTTLGFGDITFTSDLGRAFSILVLLFGVVVCLIMLPFTFIQHFYTPWMERQKRGMVPRTLPDRTEGHVLIAGTGPIARSLSRDLKSYGIPAYILSADMQEAMALFGRGYDVVLGEHDDMSTYRTLRADKAALLMVMDTDIRSTNIVFSAREAAPSLSIVAGVEKAEARDILRMAGCSRCFHFYSLLGESLAQRVIRPTNRASILARFSHVIVAEASVMKTPLAGKSLIQSNIRALSGVNVVGVWERGVFSLPHPGTTFSQSTVLMVAGSDEQIKAFNRLVSSSDEDESQRPPAIILGGGRVGIAVARSLTRRGIRYVVVDKEECHSFPEGTFIHGDATDLSVLEKAGIRQAPSLIVTTHSDDTNIYLCLYCRRLRPDIQIISRASMNRNVNGLHMAGADLVLSLASLVSSTVLNLLSPDKVLLLSERLFAFRYTVHDRFLGVSLKDSGIRGTTGCSVLSVHATDGTVTVNPDANYVFQPGDAIYLIGDSAGQNTFRAKYGIDADYGRSVSRWDVASSPSGPFQSAG